MLVSSFQQLIQLKIKMDMVARESQWSSLVAALEETGLPQSLLIWGPPSSGKTFVFEGVLAECKIAKVARISAIEIMCGKRPFFETLLIQLVGGGGDEPVKCENLRGFVRQLRTMYRNNPAERIAIIIDEAEYLRQEQSDMLEVFAKLQELTQRNFCVVLFSNVVSSLGFNGVCAMRNILSVHFPQYLKEEIVNIITTCYEPKNVDGQLFSAYVGMVVNVFYQSCRDLKKLLRLILSNWDSVQQQHANHDHDQQQSFHKVWKNIVPQLRQDFKVLNSSFLPLMTTTSNPYNKSSPTCSSFNATTTTSISSINKKQSATKTNDDEKSRNHDEIPKYSRYILIASYLATHNPPSSDKRFFVKGSTRKTGKKVKLNVRVQLEENENANERTKALRSFDQNRLKSIFAFLVSYCSGGVEMYDGSVDWLIQISSLCQAHFMQQLGEDTSGNTKYRCLADYDFISELSNTVDFELDKHLYRLL